jgi:hypothetical protein
MEIKIGKADRLVTVDYDALTQHVKDYVIRYGLTQILNDACSSVPKEKPAEAFALATKKLAALQAGEVRTRRDGGDEIEREAVRLALIRVKASATFKGKSSKEQSEAARKYAPQFRDQARKNLDELPELSLD